MKKVRLNKLAALALAGLVSGAASAEVYIGAAASDWESGTFYDPSNGLFGVGGSGQLNGEFVIAEDYGVEIGLRATDRADGLLVVSPKGRRVGTYEACTGTDGSTTNRAEWNYDIHFDSRGSGLTEADFDISLTTNFTPFSGVPFTFDPTISVRQPGLYDGATLFQQSWNAGFNDEFDFFEEKKYNLVLRAEPKFGGDTLVAHIRVNVQDC